MEKVFILVNPEALFCVFFLILLLELHSRWILRRTNTPTTEEKNLKRQLLTLAKKAKRLNSVETFVELSMVQREYSKLEAQLAEMEARRKQDRSSSAVETLILRYGKAVCLLVCQAFYWGESLAEFPPGTLFPVSTLLAFPNLPAGNIGIMGWWCVSLLTIKRLVR